jgi:hypothetical protein
VSGDELVSEQADAMQQAFTKAGFHEEHWGDLLIDDWGMKMPNVRLIPHGSS